MELHVPWVSGAVCSHPCSVLPSGVVALKLRPRSAGHPSSPAGRSSSLCCLRNCAFSRMSRSAGHTVCSLSRLALSLRNANLGSLHVLSQPGSSLCSVLRGTVSSAGTTATCPPGEGLLRCFQVWETMRRAAGFQVHACLQVTRGCWDWWCLTVELWSSPPESYETMRVSKSTPTCLLLSSRPCASGGRRQ